jgi:hypothetical protein
MMGVRAARVSQQHMLHQFTVYIVVQARRAAPLSSSTR